MGRYRSVWGDAQVLLLNGELLILDPSQPDPKLGMDKLIPVSEHTFRIETSEHFGNQGEPAIFELDAAGRVVRLELGNTYVFPVDHW